jgi:hypothetical protein
MNDNELWTPTVAAMLVFDCGMMQVRGIQSVEKDSFVFSSGFELSAIEIHNFQNTITKSERGEFPGHWTRSKDFSRLALQILGHEAEYFVSQSGTGIPVDSIMNAAKQARLGVVTSPAADMLPLYRLGASLLWQDFEDLKPQAQKNLSVLAEQSYIPTPFDRFRSNNFHRAAPPAWEEVTSAVVLPSSSTLSTWGTW